MTTSPRQTTSTLSVGRLAIDPRSKEAWKDSRKLPLAQQSFEILLALMERPGEVLTREELRRRLWPDGTFVDFDQGLNAAIKKLRIALDDSPERPQFIETLPRVGYRLVKYVEAGVDSHHASTPPSELKDAPNRAATYMRIRVAAAGLLLMMAAGVWLWIRFHVAGVPDERLTIRRLTSLGNVVDAAISPDGKYLAYVTSYDTTLSLWLKQVGMPNEVLLRREEGFWGARFSPDGRFLYYGVKTAAHPEGTLFRIPALGGQPEELLTEIESTVSFAPDGSRFAFLRRNHPTRAQSSLLTANADGTDIRVIATRHEPEIFAPIFFNAPSWSPDGKWIACSAAGNIDATRGTMLAFRPDGSGETKISDKSWFTAQRLQWLPDGSGLLAVATEEAPRSPQIWLVPFHGGPPKRITADLRQYRLIDVTADGRSFVTVAMERDCSIWRVPLSPGGTPDRITKFPLEIPNGLSAMPNGDILMGSYESGHPGLWVLSRDGTTRRPFRNLEATDRAPAISRRGEVAFVTEDATGSWLAVAALDGSHFRKIARAVAARPSFSPDGQTIVFTAHAGGLDFLSSVAVQGGKPTRLTGYAAKWGDVSPDGRWIAADCADSSKKGKWDLCVLPFTGGAPVMRVAHALPESSFAWSADGKEVFASSADDWANIYAHPLDGSPPRRVTSFEDQRLAGVTFADGGQSLLVFRERLIRDAYLISGFGH